MAHLEETALAEEEVAVRDGGAAAVGLATESGAGAASVLHSGSGAEDGALTRGERALAKALVGGAGTGKG